SSCLVNATSRSTPCWNFHQRSVHPIDAPQLWFPTCLLCAMFRRSRMYNFARKHFAWIVLLGLVASAYAQPDRRGAVRGTVSSPEGGPIATVRVLTVTLDNG